MPSVDESLRGLPERLPEGERLLWQGAPDWRRMALNVFHVRGLALYFGAIIAYCLVAAVMDGTPLQDAALSTAKLAGAALLPIGFLTGYAGLVGRSTTYTITDQRVVMQFGLTLPMTINLPFGKIESVELKQRANGFGDISLLLNAGDKLAYLVLWPHARPWRLGRAEPTFRAIPDAGRVGQLLARALAASADMPVSAVPETRPGYAVTGANGSQTPVAA
jgi:hypothetical protein